MATHSDEEALDTLLEQDHPEQSRARSQGRASILLLGVALALAVVVACGWGTGRPHQIVADLRFEEKAEGEAAVDPHQAMERSAGRQQLVIEQDLKTLLHGHVSGRHSHFTESTGSDGGHSCFQQAGHLFDDVIDASSLKEELEQEEMLAFKDRFTSAVQKSCKDVDDTSEWHDVAGFELEQQKPVMTAAMASSLNKAGLGFTAKMHDWLLHESVATFHGRLGLLPTPLDQKSVFKNKPTARQASASVPIAFRAELKWPECKEAILRIHNQGHCGSCWAFGGLASIDARMCIAAGGNWDAPEDTLSRLHVTSCAPGNYWQGHDGCQGGFPHWPMEMMEKSGVASSSCLPYYISGEGTEHFEQKDTAPPCEAHCQGGYDLPLSNDSFSSAGVGNYNWLTHVHGDVDKIRLTKIAILQEGPVAFAFMANHAFMSYHKGVFSVCSGHDRANHAVYAFGWGLAPQADGGDAVEYIEASNSWGPNWGLNGHFRIHPRCVTDVTIPGPIGSSAVNHRIGTVDPAVPRDPRNPNWPWPAPAACPYVDGCVTDMEGAGTYSNNEKCVSHELDGKKIRVAEFDTERGYDVVTVNGIMFSGKEGAGLDSTTLNGLTVAVEGQGIKFESDFSQSGPGFKICEDRA